MTSGQIQVSELAAGLNTALNELSSRPDGGGGGGGGGRRETAKVVLDALFVLDRPDASF